MENKTEKALRNHRLFNFKEDLVTIKMNLYMNNHLALKV